MTSSVSSTLDCLTLDMKTLVKRIQQLSHLGIEDNNIALPKICVVGDQSTGKSSLIEGISEIKVPRSAGTCTRCPMEINLTESEPGEGWACTIYLSRRYWFDPDHKMGSKTKRPKSLGPWIPSDGQDDEFFATLTDKKKIQEYIKWAQLAILNPSADSQTYVPGKNAKTKPVPLVKFSPNIVRLDIKGREFPALSFYDLPGVISQAEHDDETYLVGLVENLVRRYVSEQNCIVLLTLPMTDDATNSSAAKIVRDIKGAKERTLGVLTKPDRLPESDSFDQWNEILQDKKFKLGHGYYVIRNNPDPEVEHAVARNEEEVFFAHPFWSGNLAAFQRRFGTRYLQTALSAILMKQIQNCLPSIIEQINKKATRIETELATLPGPPIENVQRILIEKTTTLGLKLNSMFEGGIGHGSANDLQTRWNHLVMDFQTALRTTRPKLKLTSSSDEISLAAQIDSDCDVVYMSSSPKRKRKGPPTEPKTTKTENGDPPSQANNDPPAKVNSGPDYKTDLFSRWSNSGRPLTLEEIRGTKEQYHRAGIPNQIDPRAIVALNQKSVMHWGDLANTFVAAVHGVVRGVLTTTLDEIVAQYRQTNLYRELHRIINEFLAQLGRDYLDSALAHFCIEYDTPFTMAREQHRQAKQLALEVLSHSRTQYRARCWRTLRGYSDDDTKHSKPSLEELGEDPFAQEIEMMAVRICTSLVGRRLADSMLIVQSSRAYYDIASSRFLDVICQIAHIKVFSKCRTALIEVIHSQLDANCQLLLIARVTD